MQRFFAPIILSASLLFNTLPAMSQMLNTATPQAARQMMQSDPTIAVIDVREPDEFASGHIPNARNFPLSRIENGEIPPGIEKGKTTLVYCRSGRRSGMAVRILNQQGYRAVNFGGILDWPYDITR